MIKMDFSQRKCAATLRTCHRVSSARIRQDFSFQSLPQLAWTQLDLPRLATACHNLPRLGTTCLDFQVDLKTAISTASQMIFSPCCQLELKLFNQIVQARKRARATECALCISLSIILAYSFLTNVLSFSALHFHCGISYAAVTRHVCLA